MRAGLARWAVYNVVGFGGYLLQIGTLALLTREYGWPAAAATAVALEAACLHNFFGHNWWTWRDVRPRTRGAWLTRWWRFQGVKAAGLAGNLAITAALVTAGLAPELANTLAVLACAAPNFLAADRLVFTGPPRP